MCDLEQQRAVFQHLGVNTNEEEYTSAGNRKRRQNRKVLPVKVNRGICLKLCECVFA